MIKCMSVRLVTSMTSAGKITSKAVIRSVTARLMIYIVQACCLRGACSIIEQMTVTFPNSATERMTPKTTAQTVISSEPLISMISVCVCLRMYLRHNIQCY